MTNHDGATTQQAITKLQKEMARVAAARDEILAKLPAGCLEKLDKMLEAT